MQVRSGLRKKGKYFTAIDDADCMRDIGMMTGVLHLAADFVAAHSAPGQEQELQRALHLAIKLGERYR